MLGFLRSLFGKPAKQGRNDLSEWEPFGGWRKRPPAPSNLKEGE